MKKLITRTLLVAMLAVAAFFISQPFFASGAGHIDYENVIGYLRTGTPTYEVWFVNVASNNTTDVTPGVGGVLGVSDFSATGATAQTITNTTTIANPPHPCKVLVYVKDDDTNNTLTCTGDITLVGRSQFGVEVNEVISTDLVEGTPAKSKWAYEVLTSYSAAGCSGEVVADTGDNFMVACAPDIGVPLPLVDYRGLITICAHDEDGSNDGTDTAAVCWPGTALNDGSTEDFDPVADTIKLYDNSINTTGIGQDDDVGGAALNFTWSDGDRVYIRVRPPTGK